MSWLQALRDDFTLRPFENHHTRSDGAAMASGPPDVMVSQEPEVQEESSGKKKSKFQTFKNFFAKKKRKEPSATGAEAGLTASQSTDNVSKTSENNTLTRSEKDKGSGSKISLGSKALSHDSVFVSESSEANEALGASQDSIHGKVKSLQLQLKQAIILGSPPSLMCVKKTEDGTTSEDDGLPCSPPEYTTHHTAMNQAQRNSSVSLEGIDSDGDQLSCAVSSRAVSPLVVPGDFSQPASPFGCLDNSAAKHKLGLRHKACNKRKPASKLEVKAEGDSLVDDEQEQQTIEALSFDERKPKVEKEEEEEEEEEEEVEDDEEEEIEQPQHSRQSLLINSDEAEQDVFHDPDTSSPPEQSLSEEEVPDIQPLPSSKPSSRASSLDSPRASPEPAAAAREYLLDPPDTAYGAEDDRVEMELALTGDRVQEHGEEECSLLQEVLSSLKTPLLTCSLDMETEGIIQKMEEEAKEQEREEDETEEGEEMKEEEVDEPVTFQAPLSGSLLVGSTAVEEEEAAALSCQGEVVVPGEEAAKEDEEVVVEQFCHHSQEEEAEKVKPEDENYFFARKADVHTEEEAEEEYLSEREEEVIELEMESGVEEEGRDKTEEDDEMDVMEEKKTAEEAIEEEKDDAEEMTEWFPDAAAEEVEVAMLPQEVDEGVDVVVGDDTVYTAKHTDDDDEEKPTEPDDEEFTIVHECQTNYSHSSADGEERAEEVVEIEHTEQKSDQEEDEEANQPVADETEQGMEQESVEMSHLDLEDMENDQTEAPEQAVVSAKPPSLSLPTSHFDTQPQESGAITPSKISTTTLHINLVSPSSEKATSFFQKSPITAEPKENSAVSGKQSTASTEEEQADCAEEVEEEAPPPASVVEVVSQPSRSSDHSKVRFTIAPVWQRSHSLTPPSSPSACVPSSPSAATGPGDEEVGAASTKDPAVEAQPTGSAKAELVLSPSKTRNAGSSTAKPQDSAADIEESSVIVEGNPDNPFGVRLRKTPVLHRLSSEEESPSEPLIQPTVCKAEPPQPTGVKPLINQPNGNKPALPKKPDVHGDSGGKTKCISGPAIGCGVSGGSDSPSWISVARQKQMIYKDNSLDEITVKKEGQERKSSLPVYISSAASRQQSSHTAESANKVSPLEISKPPESLEKDTRRALAPPTPVPPQPLKSQLLPCPVSPKPPSQPYPASRTLSPPTPVPRKSSSSPSPPSLSKCATFVPSSKTNEPQDMVLTSSPFSDRTALEKSGTRAPGLSGQTSSSQRGLPPPALPQDEPPWMALAKKKAKAWSEMPQIVQ